MSKETIGIVGAGNIGKALGRRFTAAGYKVVFGVRKPESVHSLIEELSGAAAVSPADLPRMADILFLAVPGILAVEVATSLGDLSGSILVDCTNPIRWDAGPVWTPPEEGSVTAAISSRCPGVRAVKAFNTFGSEFHENPDLGGSRVQVPMASDDADAKEKVAELAEAAGFRAIDAGPLRNASVLENHAVLWIHLALAGGHGRDFVFNMTQRQASAR